MTEMLKVRAVPGRLCPYAPPRPGYIGYELALDADKPDHAIPGGGRYRRVAAVEVPNTTYYRRALNRGDIARVDETPVEVDEAQDAAPPDPAATQYAEPKRADAVELPDAVRLPTGVVGESDG